MSKRKSLISRNWKELSVIFFMTLISCSNNVEEKEAGIQSTFEVLPVVSYSASPEFKGLQNGTWTSFPNHNLIQLKACLKDTALDIPIHQEEIKIETPLGHKTKITDQAGCFTWSEDIEFQFLSQENWFHYPIRLIGLNGHVGEYDIPLVINPWAEGSNAVRDLRYDKLSFEANGSILEAKDYQEGLRELPLNFENISLVKVHQSANRESKKSLYEYDFQFSPVVYRNKMDGSPVKVPMLQGLAKVHATFLEIDSNTDEIFKISETVGSYKVSEGKASGKLHFEIPGSLKERPDSKIQILLNIMPQNAPKSFVSVSGLLAMKGSSQNSLNKLMPVNIDKASIIEKSETVEESPIQSDELVITEDNTDEIVSERIQTDDFGFEVASINVQYGSFVGAKSYQAKNKRLRVRANICLIDSTNPQSPKALNKTRFNVEVLKNNGSSDGYEEARNHKTGADGCFETYAYLDYDKYDCEQYFQLNFKIKSTQGSYAGIEKLRSVKLNPWNPSDFSYDIGKGDAPAPLQCIYPRVHFAKVQYRNEGINKESFILNQYLHLSFKRKLQITLNPLLEKFTSFQEEKPTEKITFGKFNLKVSIMAPKKAGLDYNEPNFHDFKLLASTQKQVEVSASGQINEEVELPFLASETMYLSYKNLLIIEAIPVNPDSKLQSSVVVTPFYGSAEGGNLPGNMFEGLPLDLNEEINTLASKDYKFPGAREGENFKNTSLEIYQAELARKGKKLDENFKTTFGDIESFKTIPPLEGRWNYSSSGNKKKYHTQLSKTDLRTLSTLNGKTPKRLLAKFCRLFYPLPGSKVYQYKVGKKTKPVSSDDFENCLSRPQEHLKRIPQSHIVALLGQKEVDSENFPGLNVVKAKFIKDNIGKINRGNAFFAAYGDRSSTNMGSRDSRSIESTYSYDLLWPGPFYLGFSHGISQSHETYTMKNTASMKAAFNRNYTSLDLEKMQYNELILGFAAKVKNCVTIMSKKALPVQFQFCQKEARLKRFKETWYFIGDTDAKKHGIIADGTRPGETQHSQLIRGKSNFERLWKILEKKDTLLIVQEMGEVDLTDAFQNYINGREDSLPYDSFVDNSFPGMIVPEVNTATSNNQ